MSQVEHIDTDKLKTLITVQGLINAGIFIWVQYWAKTYDIYVSNVPADPIWHVSLIISILYTSVFVSLIGIVFALLSFKKAPTSWMPRISLSLFGLSFLSIMMVIIVSIAGIIPKAFEGAEKWYALGVSRFDPRWVTIIAYGVLFVFFVIFLFGLSKKLARHFLEDNNFD